MSIKYHYFRSLQVDLFATERRRELYYQFMAEQSLGDGRGGACADQRRLDSDQTLDFFTRVLGANEGIADMSGFNGSGTWNAQANGSTFASHANSYSCDVQPSSFTSGAADSSLTFQGNNHANVSHTVYPCDVTSTSGITPFSFPGLQNIPFSG